MGRWGFAHLAQCRGFVTNGIVITGYYANLTRYYQYATLMSPNQGETAVCGSSILCWMTGEAITSCRK